MNRKKILASIGGLLFGLVMGFLSYIVFHKPILKDYPILHDEKFGGVYAKISIDDFNKLGFSCGDSVDVEFSTGDKLKDIPYYNGYYVDFEEALVVGYPGYEYIKVGINYGDDLWEKYKLSDKDKITIRLNQEKKYLKIQNARDIHYSDLQNDQSDEEFTNFREVKVSTIKEKTLYRSASPVDNSHNRAPIVDKLIKRENIQFIMNLSDSDLNIKEHIQKEDFNSPYFLSLYNSNKVIALSMSMQFKSKDFQDNMVKGFTALASHDGPYLIHCVEGKDRTGFVVMVLEALIGTPYQEMVDDYMETYQNYYSINEKDEKEKYSTIKESNLDVMLRYITGSDDLEKVDYASKTKDYLLSIGLNEDTIHQLIDKLKK